MLKLLQNLFPKSGKRIDVSTRELHLFSLGHLIYIIYESLKISILDVKMIIGFS